MRRPYLTHAQAETLARLFYGLGLRHHRRTPLRNQNLLLAALYRRFLIYKCDRVTVEGAAALRRYIDHYGTRISGTPENATMNSQLLVFVIVAGASTLAAWLICLAAMAWPYILGA